LGIPLRQASTTAPSAPRWSLDHLRFNADGAASAQEVRRRIAGVFDSTTRTRLATAVMDAEPSVVARPAASLIPPQTDDDPVDTAADAPRVGGDESLVLIHAATPVSATLAQHVAEALGNVGFAVRCITGEHEAGDAPTAANWDIALSTHLPPWAGTGERVHVEAFVDDLAPAQAAMTQALEAVAEPGRASKHWREAEGVILEHAHVVPLTFRAPSGPAVTSARVQPPLTLPALGDEVDLAALRLTDAP
ncbi:MAG: hypothetical protein AAFX85_04565, partial [Pseudomonadota bacterium]